MEPPLMADRPNERSRVCSAEPETLKDATQGMVAHPSVSGVRLEARGKQLEEATLMTRMSRRSSPSGLGLPAPARKQCRQVAVIAVARELAGFLWAEMVA
jgi:hypothetical protein